MDVKEFCELAQKECQDVGHEMVNADVPKETIALYVEQFWNMVEMICQSRSYLEAYEQIITEKYGEKDFKEIKEKANKIISDDIKAVRNNKKQHSNIYAFPGVNLDDGKDEEE